MPTFARLTPRPLRWLPLLAATVAATLVACGGGGGVGTNGTGITQGTVSGFGSVIVDGARYDDTNARVEVETSGGVMALTQAKLGQRTGIAFGAAPSSSTYDGVATRIEVEPQMKGLVESVGASSLTVLGQTASINLTTGVGPVTVFEGFITANPAAISVGDAVEVHTVLQADGTLLATRIEKQASLMTLRVAGTVAELGSGMFKIGDLKVSVPATVLPGGSTLANGQRVVVFAATSDYVRATKTLTSNAVRIKSAATPATNGVVYLGGFYSVNAGVATIDGVRVTGVSTTAGTYVRAKGSYTSDGSFAATEIRARRSDSADDDSRAAAELKGRISAFLPASGGVDGSFMLRGTRVAVPVTLTLEACVVDNAFLEVKGTPSPSGVTASEVKCDDASDTDTGGTPDRVEGPISGFTGVASTFSVTEGARTVVVRVSATLTDFDDKLTAASLANGLVVRVEGPVTSGVMEARKIEPR